MYIYSDIPRTSIDLKKSCGPERRVAVSSRPAEQSRLKQSRDRRAEEQRRLREQSRGPVTLT
jgi:hypothetical protein